jgi:hypothetical protein
MPQQQLDPVSRYGRSGSVLLLNPTDRNIGRYEVSATPLNARTARTPTVIRGTAPTYEEPEEPEE